MGVTAGEVVALDVVGVVVPVEVEVEVVVVVVVVKESDFLSGTTTVRPGRFLLLDDDPIPGVAIGGASLPPGTVFVFEKVVMAWARSSPVENDVEVDVVEKLEAWRSSEGGRGEMTKRSGESYMARTSAGETPTTGDSGGVPVELMDP